MWFPNHIGCWAAALLNGLAMPLIALRQGFDSVLLTKLLPTSMNFASAYLFYVGVMRFQKRGAARVWPLVVALPLYAVYVWLIVQDEGLRYRPAICMMDLAASLPTWRYWPSKAASRKSRSSRRRFSRTSSFSPLSGTVSCGCG
jgi:hypothetical protein